MPGRRVFVVGVGMTKFEKPGGKDWDYPDMARIAATRALEDACVDYSAVQQVCVGYCYGDSTCGQRAVYQLGMTGIPVYNVNNNCATGSTALFMAKQFVQGGLADCVMALGFEKMEKGSLGAKFFDRTNPMDKHMEVMMDLREFTAAPPTPQMFGNAGREHMEKYGTKAIHFGKIAYKNHKNSVNNPYSQFRDEYTLDQIMTSRPIYDPLTKLQCCPTSDGGACAIVCSEEFVVKNGLQGQAVELLGMAMATDPRSTLHDKSCIKLIGSDMSKSAADQAYAEAKVSPSEIDVLELHDCFSANELVTYEALGLCGEGEAGSFIDRGDNDYGGQVVTNPSGGLISKGHPLGATGLAQCAEMCWQLRGEADKRQVSGAKTALSHNLGLGGAAVVTIYRRPTEWRHFPMKRKVSGGAGFAEDYPEKAAAAKKAGAGSGAGAGAAAPEGAAAFFANLTKLLAARGAEVVGRVGAVYKFDIAGAGKWVVDLKNGNGSVSEGDGKADCTFTCSNSDFMDLMSGKAAPQKLFMGGKLKLKGNMGLAMKLGELRKLQAKL